MSMVLVDKGKLVECINAVDRKHLLMVPSVMDAFIEKFLNPIPATPLIVAAKASVEFMRGLPISKCDHETGCCSCTEVAILEGLEVALREIEEASE